VHTRKIGGRCCHTALALARGPATKFFNAASRDIHTSQTTNTNNLNKLHKANRILSAHKRKGEMPNHNTAASGVRAEEAAAHGSEVEAEDEDQVVNWTPTDLS
jgi:hypothetical protein